jgi:hypothetical protein
LGRKEGESDPAGWLCGQSFYNGENTATAYILETPIGPGNSYTVYNENNGMTYFDGGNKYWGIAYGTPTVYYTVYITDMGALGSWTPCPSPPATPSVTPSPTPTPSVTPSTPTSYFYDVSLYRCSGGGCGDYQGGATIETSYQLDIGFWYTVNDPSADVIYIASSSSGPGDVININNSPFGSCDAACLT